MLSVATVIIFIKRGTPPVLHMKISLLRTTTWTLRTTWSLGVWGLKRLGLYKTNQTKDESYKGLKVKTSQPLMGVPKLNQSVPLVIFY